MSLILSPGTRGAAFGCYCAHSEDSEKKGGGGCRLLGGGGHQNSPLTATEIGSFLQPSVKLILNLLPIESIRTSCNGNYQHTCILALSMIKYMFL